MYWDEIVDYVKTFQSSPAPKGGRYLRAAGVIRVSPKFQSSPAPKGGRYYRWANERGQRLEFQSSPAPKGGRYLRRGGSPRSFHKVSILARPEGRALRRCAMPLAGR